MYSYNDRGHLTRIESRDALSTVLAAYAYSPDATGRQRGVAEEHSGRTVTWSYDDTYRLTLEDIDDPARGDRTATYVYDDVGNRTSKVDSLDGTTMYVYDDNDRLTSQVSGTATTYYGYDNNGNQTSKTLGSDVTDYEYDARNLLVEVTRVPNVYTYEYDVDGARTAQILSGARINHLVDKNWPNAHVLRETDELGFEVAHHVFGRGEILSSVALGVGTVFMVYDAQGSVRHIVDVLGSISAAYGYDAWGGSLDEDSSRLSDYGFSGDRFDDETGLSYLRARRYDPSLGRLTSADAFPWLDNAPSTINRFIYSRNDPVTFRDPSGNFSIVGAAVAVGVVLTLSSLAYGGPDSVAAARRRFDAAVGADLGNRRALVLGMAIATAERALAHLKDHARSAYDIAFDPLSDGPPGAASAREAFVRRSFEMMFAASTQRIVSYDTSECQFERSGVIAVSYGDEIVLCPRFFLPSPTDFYSPGLVVIHELAHAAAGVDDISTASEPYDYCLGVCYNEEDAVALAGDAPGRAIFNAANYQYAAWWFGFAR
jgi:RHS repeat-associated protein